jgi:hypothetical protein
MVSRNREVSYLIDITTIVPAQICDHTILLNVG